MTAAQPDVAAKAIPSASPWSPFRHAAFTVLWVAAVVSNIGTWMYSAASGWLMTSLDPDPLIVSLVQVATTAPMFLFALPAGAFADIFDKRRMLLVLETAATVVAAVFAAIVALDLSTPLNLLLFTFLGSVFSALTAPAWQSVTPLLVPKPVLGHAIAANSVGVNVSRAIGPALGGAMIGALGIASPFWFNAISNLGIIGALIWWRPPPHAKQTLPTERFGSAMRAGFRHARYNPQLRATMIRAVGFFLFASAYWALLPLVARNRIAGGPELYGVLLGAIGVSAVGGAFLLPWLRKRLGADRLVALGTIGTATTLVLFGLARTPLPALIASIIAGASWIAVLASLNVSAQLSLPNWVRGRGLSMFVMVFFGALTLGSAIWGKLAGSLGLAETLFIAAAGALLAIPLTWRAKLQTGAGVDLTPSMHWPAPITTQEIGHDRGPVLVTVEYFIDPAQRRAFLDALKPVAVQRRRDGASRWGIFEDTAEAGRMIETFVVDSWLEHLRQHERVTNADRVVLDAVIKFHCKGEPKVTHMIYAEDED